MLYMPVHKDVLKYRKKVMWGLTTRMLGFGAAGIGCGVAMGLYLANVIFVSPTSAVGQLLIAAVSLPFLTCALARPQGLRFEEWAYLRARRALVSQRIPYVQTPSPAEGAKEKRSVRVDEAYRKLSRKRGIELWSPDGTGLE